MSIFLREWKRLLVIPSILMTSKLWWMLVLLNMTVIKMFRRVSFESKLPHASLMHSGYSLICRIFISDKNPLIIAMYPGKLFQLDCTTLIEMLVMNWTSYFMKPKKAPFLLLILASQCLVHSIAFSFSKLFWYSGLSFMWL